MADKSFNRFFKKKVATNVSWKDNPLQKVGCFATIMNETRLWTIQLL